MNARRYDITVFGATGFTGQLVVKYLSAHAPSGTRFALAGRNADKLAAVRASLQGSACPPTGVETADSSDPSSLAALARQSRVLITTVGPYERFGEPVAEACADAGTHYVDITGERGFVLRLLERLDTRARAQKAALVSCCGFDSIPHDLGAFFTAGLLPSDRPMQIAGYVAASGGYSGGTWHSLIGILNDTSLSNLGGPPVSTTDGRKVGDLELGVHRERKLGYYALPLPTIDPWMVRRSAAALERYGPDFRYGHYLRTRSLPKAFGIGAGAASLFALSKFSPTRSLLLQVKDPGDGPDEAQRARGFFSVIFVGKAGGKTVCTEVKGGDPGYGETAKMLSESALCLAFDDETRPKTYGVITPAVAMGETLIKRLRARDIQFSVREGSEARSSADSRSST